MIRTCATHASPNVQPNVSRYGGGRARRRPSRRRRKRPACRCRRWSSTGRYGKPRASHVERSADRRGVDTGPRCVDHPRNVSRQTREQQPVATSPEPHSGTLPGCATSRPVTRGGKPSAALQHTPAEHHACARALRSRARFHESRARRVTTWALSLHESDPALLTLRDIEAEELRRAAALSIAADSLDRQADELAARDNSGCHRTGASGKGTSRTESLREAR